jgi:hypothetical protein
MVLGDRRQEIEKINKKELTLNRRSFKKNITRVAQISSRKTAWEKVLFLFSTWFEKSNVLLSKNSANLVIRQGGFVSSGQFFSLCFSLSRKGVEKDRIGLG